MFAIVDDADLAAVSGVRWGLFGRYAGRHEYRGGGRAAPRRELVMMHRVICPAPETVDHINGDALDNRRANLRPATRSQNAQNVRRNKRNQSGFKGVNHRGDNGKFRARIRVAGKLITLGQFDTGEEAHAAYIAAAREHFGAFARAS